MRTLSLEYARVVDEMFRSGKEIVTVKQMVHAYYEDKQFGQAMLKDALAALPRINLHLRERYKWPSYLLSSDYFMMKAQGESVDDPAAARKCIAGGRAGSAVAVARAVNGVENDARYQAWMRIRADNTSGIVRALVREVCRGYANGTLALSQAQEKLRQLTADARISRDTELGHALLSESKAIDETLEEATDSDPGAESDEEDDNE